jgi:hypothetical protein
MLSISRHKGNANQKHKTPFHPRKSLLLVFKNKKKSKRSNGKNVEKLEPLCIAGRKAKLQFL